MRVIQRELDDRLGSFPIGLIGACVFFFDLAFECLYTAFLDQPVVTVDRVTRDVTESWASDTLPTAQPAPELQVFSECPDRALRALSAVWWIS